MINDGVVSCPGVVLFQEQHVTKCFIPLTSNHFASDYNIEFINEKHVVMFIHLKLHLMFWSIH